MTRSVEVTLDEALSLNLSLHVVHGSEVHGINVGESSDRDEMAFYRPTLDEAIGLFPPAKHLRYRTAYERRGEGDYTSHPPSRFGDLDLTVYLHSYWAELALSGSPFILTPLFVGDEYVITADEFGQEARAERMRFISRHVATKGLGYMVSQYEQMMGIRPIKVHRHELVAKFGFDVKFAAHMLRTGIQSISVLEGRGIEMPVNEKDAAFIRQVRAGEVAKEEAAAKYQQYHKKLISLLDGEVGARFPEHPDIDWINDWVIRATKG